MAIVQKLISYAPKVQAAAKNAATTIYKKATTKDPLINKAPLDFIGLGEGTAVKGAQAANYLKSNIGKATEKLGSVFGKSEGAAAKQTAKVAAKLETKTAASTGRSTLKSISENLPSIGGTLKTGAKLGTIVGVGYGITQLPAGVKAIGKSLVGGIQDKLNPTQITVDSTDKGTRYRFEGENDSELAKIFLMGGGNVPASGDASSGNEKIGHSPSLDDWMAGYDDPVLMSDVAGEKKSSLGIAILVGAAAYLAYESSKKKKKEK